MAQLQSVLSAWALASSPPHTCATGPLPRNHTGPACHGLSSHVLPELPGAPFCFRAACLPFSCVSFHTQLKSHLLCETISDLFFPHREGYSFLLWGKKALPTLFCPLFWPVLFEILPGRWCTSVLRAGPESYSLQFCTPVPNAIRRNGTCSIHLSHECLLKTIGQDSLIREIGTCLNCLI